VASQLKALKSDPSPATGSPAFVLGAPRSGTTFLMLLLSQHRAVAAPMETGLFSDFVAPIRKRWETQLEYNSNWEEQGLMGLPTVLTEEEFDSLVLDFVEGIYDKFFEKMPGSSVVVEKVPGYSLHTSLLRRYFPEARFIHILRDGREVASSLVDASKGWARRWAPGSIEDAARVWRRFVEGASSAREFGTSYLEVRYDDLVERTEKTISEVFEFLSLDDGSGDVDRILESLRTSRPRELPEGRVIWSGEARRRIGAVPPGAPDGFIRKGSKTRWEEWSTKQRWLFDRIAGDLLVELGFEKDRAWVGSTWRLELSRMAKGFMRRPLASSNKALAIIGSRGRGSK
jgi:hypothetical protein